MSKATDALIGAAVAMGITMPVAIGGLAGAALSLRFMPTGTERRKKVAALFGSYIATLCLTPWVLELVNAAPSVQGAVAFFVGLYGWSVLREGEELIQSGALQDWVKSFMDKKTGG